MNHCHEVLWLSFTSSALCRYMAFFFVRSATSTTSRARSRAAPTWNVRYTSNATKGARRCSAAHASTPSAGTAARHWRSAQGSIAPLDSMLLLLRKVAIFCCSLQCLLIFNSRVYADIDVAMEVIWTSGRRTVSVALLQDSIISIVGNAVELHHTIYVKTSCFRVNWRRLATLPYV